MQHTVQDKGSMNVPNWLIALELGAGVALLYISSSALVNTSMHMSRSINAPETIEQRGNTPSSFENKIILSAHSDAGLYSN